MDKLVDTLRKYDLIRALVFGIIGALIVWQPRTFFQFAVYILAGLFVLMGAFNLITVKETTGDATGAVKTSGVLLLVAAVVILIFAKPIVSIIPFFLGLFTLLAGIRQLMQEIKLQRSGLGQLPWFIFSILIVIIGGVLVFNPFKSVMLLFQIFGGVLIILGISQVVAYFQNREA